MDSTQTVPDRSQKGKVASRSSWTDLPHELLRVIADTIVNQTWHFNMAHSPWREHHFQPQQKLYAGLFAAQSLFSMRRVCPQWEVALEQHWVWNYVLQFLDPHAIDPQYTIVTKAPVNHREGGSAHSAPPQVRYRVPRPRTFTNYVKTLERCCLPCRFINPAERSTGIAAGVDSMWTRNFGQIALCDRHRSDSVCGICIKDSYVDTWRVQNGRLYIDNRDKSIYITEDDEVFRGITATCRSCRSKTIWGAMSEQFARKYHHVIEPIVDGFVECGEGVIAELLADADQKIWMMVNTNYTELRDSALALERMRLKQEIRAEREAEEAAEGRRTSEARLAELLDQGADPAVIEEAIARQVAEDEDDDELVDEDLGEFLNATEELNIYEMALGGWARSRILEGCWISPWDVHKRYYPTGMRTEHLQRLKPAWHPVNSYLNPAAAEPTSPDGLPLPTMTPHPRTIHCVAPPSRILTKAQGAWDVTFREIVMPALQNLVRRLANEAEMERKDVCQAVLMFNPSRILEELMTIQLWGVDYDWMSALTSPTITSSTTIDSASDRDRDSPRDSPPSTIRTTPSPTPPASTSPKSNGEVFAAAQRATAFPLQPIPTSHPLPHQYLRHIPHVPRSQEHVGPWVLRTIDNMWKEVTSGLFKCQCTICRRANGIAESREKAQAKEEEAKMEVTDDTPQPKRQKAPSPSPRLKAMQLAAENDEEGEILSPLSGSPSPPPRFTPESEDHIPMQGVETPRSLQSAGRRRSREELEDGDLCSSDDDSRGAKKLRIATAEA